MGMLGAFIVGYILGTRAGPDGIKELRKAWSEISKSPEFQSLMATGVSVVGATVSQLSQQAGANANGKSHRATDPGVISMAVFREIRERLA